jgi:hypothetical protein
MDEDPTPGTPASEAATQEPQEAPDPAGEDSTTLTLVGPSYCTRFNLPEADGSTLVIDRAGTTVPSEDVDRIMAAAASAGVTLTRKAH